MNKALCDNKKTCMFGLSLLILTLIVAVILALVAAPAHPLTWVLVATLVSIPFIYKKLATRKYLEWKDEYCVGIDSIDQPSGNRTGSRVRPPVPIIVVPAIAIVWVSPPIAGAVTRQMNWTRRPITGRSIPGWS